MKKEEDPTEDLNKMLAQAKKEFKEFKNQFKNNAPRIFGLHDDEDDCNALTSDSQCNANSDKCSWCISAAVKPACHSIENAKSLPSAVFQCSNIDKFAFFDLSLIHI